MIAYLFYFLLVVGLSVLLSASFRRLRGDSAEIARPEEDAAFDRRMAAIEKRFGTAQDEPEQLRDEGADD